MSDPGPPKPNDTFACNTEERDQIQLPLLMAPLSHESKLRHYLHVPTRILPDSPTPTPVSQQKTTIPSVTMSTDSVSPQFLSDTEASSLKTDSDAGRDAAGLSPSRSDDTVSKSSSEHQMDSLLQSKSSLDPSTESTSKSKSTLEKIARKMKLPHLKVPPRSSLQASHKTTELPFIESKSAPVVLGPKTTSVLTLSSTSHTDSSKTRKQKHSAFPALTEATAKAFLIAEAITSLSQGPSSAQVVPKRSDVPVLPPLPQNVTGTVVRDVIDRTEKLSIKPSSSKGSRSSAAAKLKHTEGAVKLTVCTPNLKDKKEDAPLAEETGSATTSVPAGSAASRSASGNQTPDPGLAAAGSSRPHSPRPAPSPVRTEPPADPATAPIQPNQDTIIEITTESQSLGLFLLGGSDTSINGPAAVVLDVIQDRPVGRDGRLQRGDQIRAACGIQLTEAMTEDRLNMTIKQWAPKLKFTVFRPDPIQYEDIEVDVNRKQKPLGFSFAAFSNDRGIYITQILPGSPAEQDGRLRRGDHILTVDGKDVSSAEFTAASVALKLIGPKVSIKIRRLKIVR